VEKSILFITTASTLFSHFAKEPFRIMIHL